ncbi:MAG: hypothetical protein IJF67_10380, partial [Clostridia bacterium]|nr:hypothetical protein [Clostridia bacterium]
EYIRSGGIWTPCQPEGDIRTVGWLNASIDALHFDGRAVPYIADALAVVYEQTDGPLAWVRRPSELLAPDGRPLDPYAYDEYLYAAPEDAAALKAAADAYPEVLALYLNDKKVDGVLVRRDAVMLDGRVITEEYSFVYGKTMPREEITHLRIELRLP